MLKKNILMVLAISVLAIFAISCSSSDGENSGSAADKSEGQNTQASSGSAISFTAVGVDGKTYSYNDFVGKPLIINFWGTWCPPCKMEMPDIQRIYDEYKPKGLEIVGLAVERNPNNVEGVQRFVNQFEYSWIMLMADQSNKRALGLGGGIPYTLFIDKDGQILEKFTGYRNYQQFKAGVEKII